MISPRTAFSLLGVLAALAFFTLDGQPRLVAIAALALFAVRVYVTILQRRQKERELAGLAAPPTRDVSTRGDPRD
jgi:Kef-type K+ transport system membrane component KefB